MNGIKIEMELGLNCIEKLSYKCNRKWVLFFLLDMYYIAAARFITAL